MGVNPRLLRWMSEVELELCPTSEQTRYIIQPEVITDESSQIFGFCNIFEIHYSLIIEGEGQRPEL